MHMQVLELSANQISVATNKNAGFKFQNFLYFKTYLDGKMQREALEKKLIQRSILHRQNFRQFRVIKKPCRDKKKKI